MTVLMPATLAIIDCYQSEQLFLCSQIDLPGKQYVVLKCPPRVVEFKPQRSEKVRPGKGIGLYEPPDHFTNRFVLINFEWNRMETPILD